MQVLNKETYKEQAEIIRKRNPAKDEVDWKEKIYSVKGIIKDIKVNFYDNNFYDISIIFAEGMFTEIVFYSDNKNFVSTLNVDEEVELMGKQKYDYSLQVFNLVQSESN